MEEKVFFRRKAYNKMSKLQDYGISMKSIDTKKNILKELDLFILDNSIRETTVGQIRGHTLENKWDIYNEVSSLVICLLDENYTYGVWEKGSNLAKVFTTLQQLNFFDTDCLFSDKRVYPIKSILQAHTII